MNNHRAKEIEKIYENLKNEPSLCGDDSEDTGGMYGLGMPGTSTGSPLLQSIQMGEVHDSRTTSESQKPVPWDSDEDSDTDFVYPSRDKGCSSDDENSDGETTKPSADFARGGYGDGFRDGMREAVSKINYLLTTQGVGLFHFDGADIFIKKETSLNIENQVDGECSLTTCQTDQRKDIEPREMKQDSASTEMDSDTDDPELVSSDEFLEILDGGLCVELGGDSKFLSLDSVNGVKFEENKNSKMTVVDWVLKLCT
ncbi:phosphoprotein [Garba virus]|uniref:Phosphoprotein n=1 Tax=Garba virus TaxID=864696 RepID=A0A0D3R0Y6_9RHAB|nr:phosphoprotein [Garba virus]AJR28273.1 phosphoprotein [Garba virus]